MNKKESNDKENYFWILSIKLLDLRILENNFNFHLVLKYTCVFWSEKDKWGNLQFTIGALVSN